MQQFFIWAWHPGRGWSLFKIVGDWGDAVEAYREAKADTNGPVYLTEKKDVPPLAEEKGGI